jgi:hypothetical protein
VERLPQLFEHFAGTGRLGGALVKLRAQVRKTPS